MGPEQDGAAEDSSIEPPRPGGETRGGLSFEGGRLRWSIGVVAAFTMAAWAAPVRSHPWLWFVAVLLAGGCWARLILPRRADPVGGWTPTDPDEDGALRGPRLLGIHPRERELLPWVFGALLVLAFLRNPWTSDDTWRYVWEAEVILEGRSPYAWPPDSPIHEGLRERMPRVYAGLNHREVSAAYPPVMQFACAGALALGKGISGRSADEVGLASVRMFFGLCALLCLLPLSRLLRDRGGGCGGVGTWGWVLCPLVLLELGASAHFDGLGILLWLAAFVALDPSRRSRRRTECLGLVALGAAILVKFLPIVSVPFLLRGRGWVRRSLGLLAVLAACCLPVLGLEGGVEGWGRGLSTYGLRWESAGLVHPWIEGALGRWDWFRARSLDPRKVSRGVIGVLFVGIAAHAWIRRVDPWRASGRLVGAFVVLSPTLYPWYVTWVVPFVVLDPRASWVTLIAVAPLIHWMVPAWQLEGRWEEPVWLWPVLAIPFFVLRTLESIRDRREPRSTHRDPAATHP